MPEFTQENRIIEILTPLGKDELLLQGFNGQEGVSQLFQFDVRMMSENRSVKLEDLVGKKATLKILLPDGAERFINGIVSSFAQGGSSMLEEGDKPTVFAHYYATLVPWLWMLTRTSDCRIFQEMTVPDILEKIFKDHGFSDYKIKLQGSFAKREYCVQYRETDFNFVARLMEEEGIYYFFEHEKEKHTLILINSPNEFKPCPLQDMVSYKTVVGQERDADVVTDFTMSREVRPGQYTIRDFNFEKPSLDLTANLSGKGDTKFEIYDYPGEYKTKDEGERLVGIRMQEEDAPQIVIAGSSTCRGFVSGYRFDLRDHFRRDFNKAYVLTSVFHSADVGESWRSSEGGESSFSYYNSFQCILHPAPFRPTRKTPVPVVNGTQTAIVVGPAGEEIYTDKYGRVKVQFHWDREGHDDENSSCWIRVSHPWAGKGWGAISIPRIGQEVIVDFLEGDPDRPIIVGRVYNAESMPPFELPAQMVQSGIKSQTHKGSGYNELALDDTVGKEEFRMHAQYDMNTVVENDQTTTVHNCRTDVIDVDDSETVGNNQTAAVGVNRTRTVGADESVTIGSSRTHTVALNEAITVGVSQEITVGAMRSVTVGANQTVTIGNNQSETIGSKLTEEIGSDHSNKVGGNRTTDIGKNETLKVGNKIMIEAGDEITLQTGQSKIVMKSNGNIEISGMKITLKGSQSIEEKAVQITIEASGVNTIKGSLVKIN